MYQWLQQNTQEEKSNNLVDRRAQNFWSRGSPDIVITRTVGKEDARSSENVIVLDKDSMACENEEMAADNESQTMR